MDKVSSQKRSQIMSRVKSSETKIEKDFRALLWKENIRYRKNNKKRFGKPDLVLAGKKTVIFIDSCFWHGCKKHLRMPASNKDYWRKKISRNIERDKIVNAYYAEKKWKVIRVWEHDLKNKGLLQKIIADIKSA